MALSCYIGPLRCHWFSEESKLALQVISPHTVVFGSLKPEKSLEDGHIRKRGGARDEVS